MIRRFVVAIVLVALLMSVMWTSGLVGVQTGALTDGENLNQYEWPQFEGDSSYTRFSAGPAPDVATVIWKADIHGIQPYLAAFNGKIYISNNTHVFALSQEGKIVWQTALPEVTTWPIAYKIDNTHMVVESYCLNSETGAILWKSLDFNAYTGIFNTNVYSPEQAMFYTKVNSSIVAWDFSNPSKPPVEVWSTYIRGGGLTGIGTVYGEGKIFTGSFENMQYALDAKTGEILWSTPTKGPMIFTGAYADGLYFKGGSDDNTMYAFNATNGDIVWRHLPDTEGYFTTGCAIAYGMVYQMNKNGYLYAFDMYTGEVVWKYRGPNDTLMWPGMPSVADGKLYMTTGESAQYNAPSGISEFSCLNAYSGQKIWALDIEALPPRESVAIAYGTLYLIPGDVTTAVDTISGNEYDTINQIWAIQGTNQQTNDNNTQKSDWPQWRADPARSSTAKIGPQNLTVAWRFNTNGAVSSSPSIAENILCVGSQDKNIYALNANTGRLLWKYTTNSPVESSPAIVNNKVYTGGDDGYVYCLDAKTGTLLWKTFVNGDLPFTFGNLILKSSPAVIDNRVYIGSLDSYLYALNGDTGDIEWQTKAKGPIESSPAVANGAVYFSAEEPQTGALYKLDAKTGDILWKYEIPYRVSFGGGTQMLGSPSVAENKVFASSNWGDYFCIDATTGEMIWRFQNPTATEFIVSSPIYVNDGTVLLVNKFDLTSVYASNGWTQWTTYTGDEPYVSPSYADGKVYMATSQRNIFIFDTTSNGTNIATATLPSSTWSSPTIANGKLYIGCNDWNIYCFEENRTTSTTASDSSVPSDSIDTIALAVIFVVVIIVAITIIGAALIYAVRRFAKM
ncbi:MAG: PQQ-binding-like beta-propeller repeat protein [Nitrososphaerota archaeon]|jgi:outer membrane protein assembly factor BamB|nr:PQQ-binding-like beta-propeller repeat protein [Nitrososphaerota archaeon]